METIREIKRISLLRLKNAEHLNLMRRTKHNLGDTAESAAKFGISATDFNAFGTNIDKLSDILAQSHISDETAELNELDTRRNHLAVHLFRAIRTERSSPLSEMKSAAESLYNITKPYFGLQEKVLQQKTQIINGLLIDLNKPENSEDITRLRLSDTVTQIEQANTRYAELTQQRSLTQIATRLGNARIVRGETDQLYKYMMTMAFVTNIHTPTDETAAFIRNQNKLIAEISASYKQRKAQLKKRPKSAEDELDETEAIQE